MANGKWQMENDKSTGLPFARSHFPFTIFHLPFLPRRFVVK